MTLRPLSLGFTSDPTKYGQEGAGRLINFWAEKTGEGAKYPFVVYGTDGLSQWTNPGTAGSVRCLFVFDSKLLAVINRTIFEIDGTGTATIVGGLASDSFVTAARNRKAPDAQVGFVSDGVFKIYAAGTVTDVEDPDMPAPVSIAGLDGYFLLYTRDGRFFITSIDEGTEIDGLDFASTEVNPDIGILNVVRGRDALFFGARSLEFWNNTGGADFPFSRTTSRDVGLYAASSVQVLTVSRRDTPSIDTVFFAATDNQGAPIGVHMLSGYDPVKISPADLDRKIAASSPDDIDSFAYSKDGQAFYVISGETWSYAYNYATGFWHEPKTESLGRFRGKSYAYFAGKHIVGDVSNGKLYELSSTVYTDGGEDLVSRVQLPTVHGYPKRLRWDKVYADCAVGVGEVSSEDYIANPEMMFDYSEDGGKTFSAERRRSMGAAGQTMTKVDFDRLGLAPAGGRTPRLSISAPVKRCIQGVYADLKITK